MTLTDTFPLRGVIGVVANSANEIDLAARHNLQCVEIRADLLLAGGLSETELMACIAKTKNLGLACLVTLRHPAQGGKFTGTEAERVAINQQALAFGADIIDLEWGTEAANRLIEERAPMILSYHNFDKMPDQAELEELTRRMTAQLPMAIKVVPTAATLDDAVRMLHWVSDANDQPVKRIGFAMGKAGACSRILTTASGAPVTYTSFGEAVAPGQIELDALLDVYRVMHMNRHSTVVAVTGNQPDCDQTVKDLNLRFKQSGTNQVAIAFTEHAPEELEQYTDVLKIAAMHPTRNK